MEKDLTKGPILKTLLLFALPMMLGNLLQQIYNITDTIIVSRVLGSGALAAVGSTYTLVTFLTSVMIGLCMGCGTLFSMHYGAGHQDKMKECMWVSFWLICAVTLVMYLIVFTGTDGILNLLQTPEDIYRLMRTYSRIIFLGIGFTFLYNYFAFVLRAVGNSVLPLIFLAISSLLNIALDLWFVIGLHFGVGGAAGATVIAQAVSGIGITIAVLWKNPQLFPSKEQRIFQKSTLSEVSRYAFFTCLQQSVMNFGILMIQGLVNSFGTAIMAAFAAAVKIDTLAYMPVQEFGNAFSTFIAQNFGARKEERIRKGVKSALITTVLFSLVISILVFLFAKPLMLIFVRPHETEILNIGISYLRIEGAFYCGIGILFLLYGYYRAIRMPGMSVVLTVVSLGTRVALSYWLAGIPAIGVIGIWWSIPIGWFIADVIGIIYYKQLKKETAKEVPAP